MKLGENFNTRPPDRNTRADKELAPTIEDTLKEIDRFVEAFSCAQQIDKASGLSQKILDTDISLKETPEQNTIIHIQSTDFPTSIDQTLDTNQIGHIINAIKGNLGMLGILKPENPEANEKAVTEIDSHRNNGMNLAKPQEEQKSA